MTDRAAEQRRIDRVGRAALAAITLGLLVVFARVVQLQALTPVALQDHVSQHLAIRTEPAPRGDILDRRGRVLAGTRMGWRVFVDPDRFPKPYDANIVALSDAAGVDRSVVGSRVMSRIAANERRREEGRGPIRYVSIGGILDDWQVEAVRRLGIAGVHLERRSVREIVSPGAAAAIVGKVGVDHDGLLGAERVFDDDVRPDDGRLSYVHDAFGRPLWIEAGQYRAPRRGDDARLSIDLALQEMAVEELTWGVERADAAGGRVIILDPRTGEILAMADIVRDVPGAAPPTSAAADPGVRYRVIPPDPGRDVHPALARNRCVEDAYEPGSTFKPFMWAAVMELGLAKYDEVIDTHGGIWRTPYGRVLEDVVPLGEQTWREVIVNSSNIGMAQVTARMSAKQMREAVLKFGFGRPTGLRLPGESAGLVTSARDWTKYTQTSVAMGYEVAVTPVQMARAVSALARTGAAAGTLPRLRLEAVTQEGRRGAYDDEDSSLDTSGGIVPVHRVLPAWVANLTRDAMKGVGEAVARRLVREKALERLPAHPVFAKSGTSKIARPNGRGYFERQYISSFVAGAPADEPRIVVLVTIEDPGPQWIARRQHFGSWVAGPVVFHITDRALEYLGVAPANRDAASGMDAGTLAGAAD